METNKGATQAGMAAPGSKKAIFVQKLGTVKCDHSTMFLQMGYSQGPTRAARTLAWDGKSMIPSTVPKLEESQMITTEL